MIETVDGEAARLGELLLALQAFRKASPVLSVGAAILFLKLVEGGGGAVLEDVAKETGIPFSQVCRFAGNLADGTTRNVSGLGLAERDPASRPGRTLYVLTDGGRELADTLRVGAGDAEAGPGSRP